MPTPAHSNVAGGLLSYGCSSPIAAGTLVRVPLGRREVLGVAWLVAVPASAPAESLVGAAGHYAGKAQPGDQAVAAAVKLKPVAAVLDALAPLTQAWLDLVAFSARYYQRAPGEVALAALPPQLRDLSTVQLARRLKRRKTKDGAPETVATAGHGDSALRPLSPEQADTLDRIEAGDGPFLLFGSTGSGKTEVYLRAVADVLEADLAAQALVMVPEINLTPQLEARFRERFAGRYGADAVVSMHSGMTSPQRLAAWLAAHSGQARIVLGTRMAVFASMPGLALIVVDEEHDASYKQQDGARYSARDLAVWRGRREGAKVILGSATPSLESWHQSRPPDGDDAGGRYTRLAMPSRIGAGLGAAMANDAPPDVGDSLRQARAERIQTSETVRAEHVEAPHRAPTAHVEPVEAPAAPLPVVRTVDMTHQPRQTVISAPLLAAIGERIAQGEQSLVLLNRRGYAPVLACSACDWKSECPHCTAYRVFHKIDRTLRCHHCGFTERVPRACPSCGNVDIAPVGRGTERLEELLAELVGPLARPDGSPVRIARIDADSTRHAGELARQLAQVHAGEIDVLVGTQMIAKGHDFRRVTLVAAVNPDGALFSSDFRAPERLFSLLMQSAGRAGRDAAWLAGQGRHAEMWLQTVHPKHPLFAALRRHDYPAFAAQQLAERRAAGMPPYASQALLRADARTQEAAQAFLAAAAQAAQTMDEAAPVTRYPPVPLPIQRVANVERAQMLVESTSRAALQRFLAAWQPPLHALRQSPVGKGLVRWGIDVDPMAI